MILLTIATQKNDSNACSFVTTSHNGRHGAIKFYTDLLASGNLRASIVSFVDTDGHEPVDSPLSRLLNEESMGWVTVNDA